MNALRTLSSMPTHVGPLERYPTANWSTPADCYGPENVKLSLLQFLPGVMLYENEISLPDERQASKNSESKEPEYE